MKRECPNLHDLRMVCNYIDQHARANGFNTIGKDRDELIDFFNAVATVDNGLLSGDQRAAHAQWRTAVRAIAKAKQHNGEANQHCTCLSQLIRIKTAWVARNNS